MKKSKLLLSGILFGGVMLPATAMLTTSCGNVKSISVFAYDKNSGKDVEGNEYYQNTYEDLEIFIRAKYNIDVYYESTPKNPASFVLSKDNKKQWKLTVRHDSIITATESVRLIVVKEGDESSIDIETITIFPPIKAEIIDYGAVTQPVATYVSDQEIQFLTFQVSIVDPTDGTAINDEVTWSKISLTYTDTSGVVHKVYNDGSSDYNKAYTLFNLSSSHNMLEFIYAPNAAFPSSSFDPLTPCQYDIVASYKGSVYKEYKGGVVLSHQKAPLTISITGSSSVTTEKNVSGTSTLTYGVSPTGSSTLVEWSQDSTSSQILPVTITQTGSSTVKLTWLGQTSTTVDVVITAVSRLDASISASFKITITIT